MEKINWWQTEFTTGEAEAAAKAITEGRLSQGPIVAEFEQKLHMYRVIENPYDLKHNQLIRWIPLRSLEARPYVTLGGTLFRVRENIEDKMHIVTIRNIKRFVFNIRFELNVVFQRLSNEELMILRAVEYIENDDAAGDADDA